MSIVEWLREHKEGDDAEICDGVGLEYEEYRRRHKVLVDEGIIYPFAYRWDGSPVWRLAQ